MKIFLLLIGLLPIVADAASETLSSPAFPDNGKPTPRLYGYATSNVSPIEVLGMDGNGNFLLHREWPREPDRVSTVPRVEAQIPIPIRIAARGATEPVVYVDASPRLLAVAHRTPPSGLSVDSGTGDQGESPLFEMEEEVEVLAREPSSKAPPDSIHGIHGRFWAEVRYGHRIRSHPTHDNPSTLKEFRVQYENTKTLLGLEGHARIDGLLDEALGSAGIDVRELYVKLPTPRWMAASVGRQVIKWGMGDLIFVNDLFPKDYVSLYTGRDIEAEYMKLPSDAVELNLYHPLGNLDVVYLPRFTPYTVPTGERLVYYSPIENAIVGEENILPIEKRGRYFQDDVLAVRYSRKLGNTELAFHGNNGYWPVPSGLDAQTQKTFYPRLRSYGAGLRGSAWRGIWTTEAAYYDSPDDPKGDDPLIPNSQFRGFIGYERELVRNLDLGVQYYAEHRQDQAAYERGQALSGGNAEPRQYELLTSRLTRRALKQTLVLSLFTFYSPTEEDYYVRANVTYKPSDEWTLYAGGNYFDGDRPNTDFARYRENSNVFMGARYYW